MIADPKARVTDPETKAAGRAVSNLRASQARILQCFKAYGALDDKQLTRYIWDLEDHLGVKRMSPSGIRSRRNELVQRGLVADSGYRATVDGRSCIIWEVTGV